MTLQLCRRLRDAKILKYILYLISAVTLMSYRAWLEAGEPAPLARRRYRLKSTDRSDIESVFRPCLRMARSRQDTRMDCTRICSRAP